MNAKKTPEKNVIKVLVEFWLQLQSTNCFAEAACSCVTKKVLKNCLKILNVETFHRGDFIVVCSVFIVETVHMCLHHKV